MAPGYSETQTFSGARHCPGKWISWADGIHFQAEALRKSARAATIRNLARNPRPFRTMPFCAQDISCIKLPEAVESFTAKGSEKQQLAVSGL